MVRTRSMNSKVARHEGKKKKSSATGNTQKGMRTAKKKTPVAKKSQDVALVKKKQKVIAVKKEEAKDEKVKIEVDEEEHLCFQPAYAKFVAGEISWEQYLHNALLHFVGRRHPGDEKQHIDDYRHLHFWQEDPVGFSLLEWQREEIHGFHFTSPRENRNQWEVAYGPKDIADLMAVFTAYKHGTNEEIQEKLSVLPYATAANIRRTLCLLALKERRLDRLEFCLQGLSYVEPWYAHYFEDTVNVPMRWKEDPDLWDIIEVSEWRKHHPWRKPGRRDSRGQ